MARYIYQVEAVSDTSDSDSYQYGEARSLREAIGWVQEHAEADSHWLDERFFRNNFRKPSMIKVGQTCENGKGIESRYAIYRYPYETGIPAERPVFP